MRNNPVYSRWQYVTKFLNTFFPKILLKLSPWKNRQKNHWGSQNTGDVHGYDKYCENPHCFPVLVKELNTVAGKEDAILDLGCNCGAYLNLLKKEGYRDLTGIDISGNAITFGRTSFDLDGISLEIGSFEEVLPRWVEEGKVFDHVYSIGATVELVHPSFDIVGYLCQLSRNTIILIINEWGHAYPRFWEYEFNANGFMLVRCIRPWNIEEHIEDYKNIDSLLVFRREPAE